MQIIAIYCLLDDYIQTIEYQDWPNVKLTTAEVMLINIVGMRFFYGNIDTARKFLNEHKYIYKGISKSALNRRIHSIPIRKFIEGAFGVISRLMARKIHAVTAQGFEIKIVGFLVAVATNFIIN